MLKSLLDKIYTKDKTEDTMRETISIVSDALEKMKTDSPKEYGKMICHLEKYLYNIDENDKFLTQESRAKILNYMGHVHNNRLIHAGLGAGAVFLHKTGDIGTMLGDAGIVIAPNGKKYIVVILANRPHNAIEGKDFIVHASELIYNYMVK